MLSLLTQPQNRTFLALPCKGDDQKQAPVWQRVLGEVVRQEVHALIDAGRRRHFCRLTSSEDVQMSRSDS